MVAVPQQRNVTGLGDTKKRGDVLIFNLDTLNLKKGAIDSPVKAALPDDGLSGKASQTVSATDDPDHYLVANVVDYNRGLSTLVLTRDGKGRVVGARMTSIRMFQKGEDVVRDRLDIQRAQSAVLVRQKNPASGEPVEYAIVSDDNHQFNDPYWRAMFEAPDFIFTPSGAPIMVGGSVNAKKVAVGGKLGVIKDPFGKLGAPEFLGATLPLDGYGVQNLSVSEDGKVLIGQLYGYFGTDHQLEQKPHQTHAWNVEALITAALSQQEKDKGRKHLKLASDAEQKIETPGSAPAGTFFDPEFIQVTVDGAMGDVIGVNLKEQAARQLLVKEKRISAAAFKLPLAKLDPETKGLIEKRMGQLKNFSLQRNEIDRLSYTDDKSKKQGLTLLTKGDGSSKVPLSRESADSSKDESTIEADFKESGILFFAPDITDKDEDNLRLGKTLNDKLVGFFFSYKDESDPNATDVKKNGEGFANVVAKDYQQGQAVFFGDRPLDNPGYSAFKLKGSVGVGQANETLDVYRVEQRLKYLGFPAIGSSGNNAIKNFDVDGKFKDEEKRALKLFEKVIRFRVQGQKGYGTVGDSSFSTNLNGADGVVASSDVTTIPNVADSGNSLDWLNAYNAPHWMDVGGQMQYQGDTQQTNYGIPSWTNTQTGGGGGVERFGVSWMRDLMRAQEYANPQFLSGLPQSGSRFKGAVDGNHGATPGLHLSHTLGMNFDLSIQKYLDPYYMTITAPVSQVISTSGLSDPLANAANGWRWSTNNAAALLSQLPNTDDVAHGRNHQADALRNFLALYSVTRKDNVSGNGTLDDLRFVNGNEAVSAALFGDGSKDGSIISRAIIGSRTMEGYPGSASQATHQRIRDVLGNLGVNTITWPNHQNHFHIDMTPPKIVKIKVSQNLVTEGMPQLVAAVTDIAAPKPDQANNRYDAVLGACRFVERGDEMGSAINNIPVLAPVADYFKLGPNEHLKGPFKITLLDSPRLGSVVPDTSHGRSANETTGYFYDLPSSSYPDNDKFYRGKDQFSFDVEAQGKHFKVIYYVYVVHTVEDVERMPINKVCPQPWKSWRISGDDTSNVLARDVSQLWFGSWQKMSDLNAFLAAAHGITLSFENLPNNAIGETVGEGSNAQITLDPAAANHGWFVDATPDANEEFLPTSDASVWQARAGSAADGKMDMLSVLLHEYGHALGIEHSADSRDFMAPNLQAGQRRLPGADELALMRQLAAALKPQQDNAANAGAPQPLPRPYDPSLPLGGGFAFTAAGLLRRKDYGWSLNLAGGQNILTPAPAQFEHAINGTLGHNANDWQSAGNVSNDQQGGVTLAENSTANAHLSQSFAVKQGDRYLSFTVAGNGLQDNGGAGPNDAFEVALLNADSGLSVAGSDGLSRSDAILNLQTDGTQHQAAGVRTVRHADGSTTYYVDLQQAVNQSNGSVTGTPVTLSFDLIGFGAQNSQVALRDIQLIQDPVAFDDAVAGAEDATLAIDPLANDLLGGGVATSAAQLRIVTQPGHGSIVVNPDGGLSYTPAAHFHGTDSFTYTTTVDGRISNIATVQLSVRHVNHAPVVASDSVTMTVTAGKPVAIDPLLLSQASDIDGDVLQALIDTPPAHGAVSINPDGSWVYAANADFAGEDSIRFHVQDSNTDGSGVNASSGVVTLHFTVQPANSAPVANNVHMTVQEDGSIRIDFADPASGLGSDAEGDPLSASITAQPAHGTVVINPDGTFTYTPEADYHGADSFSYVVNDGTVDSSVATVCLTVSAANDAPTLFSDAHSLLPKTIEVIL